MLRSLAAPLALAATALALLPASAAAEEDLFVQSAEDVRLHPRGTDRLRLQLRLPDHLVTAFADRPARTTSSEPLRRFVRRWDDRFGDDPPNAALVVDRGPRSADTLIVELGRPRLRGGRLTYPARRIDPPAGGSLAHHARRADDRLPRRLGAAHLFIDDAADQQSVALTLQMQQTGRVTVTFSAPTSLVLGSGDTAVEWVGNAGGGFLTPTTASLTGAPVPGAPGGLVGFGALAGPGPITGTVTYAQGGQGATLQVGDGAAVPLAAGPFSIPLS